MKAIVYREYGPPNVLKLEEVKKPSPKDDEVLIKVRAVSLNASDWELLTGKPAYARFRGVLKPRLTVLGSDVAGEVEAVGKSATKFKPGDQVFGDIFDRMGGFAEYVCAAEKSLVHKPSGMTFEVAATIPQGGCIALQGIRDKGRAQPGDKVLINGGGGSAGTVAIQIAKSLGAEVTGVDNTEKLDLKAYHPILDYRRALSSGGIYLMVGGSVALLFRALFLGALFSMIGSKKLRILGLKTNQDLADLIELIETGKVVPAIDKSYPLPEVAAALQYLGDGHAKGNVVISVDHS